MFIWEIIAALATIIFAISITTHYIMLRLFERNKDPLYTFIAKISMLLMLLTSSFMVSVSNFVWDSNVFTLLFSLIALFSFMSMYYYIIDGGTL